MWVGFNDLGESTWPAARQICQLWQLSTSPRELSDYQRYRR